MKLNNHNTNDYETAHANTFSSELVHRHIIFSFNYLESDDYQSFPVHYNAGL